MPELREPYREVCADPAAMRRPPPVAIARTARARGDAIVLAVCAWVRRWGWASDKSLYALYPGRPRLGYELCQRGFLRRHAQPVGERVLDGSAVYDLTDQGNLAAEKILPPVVAELHIQRSRVPWREMQHRLDLQRIAAWFGMLPADEEWITDPENRIKANRVGLSAELVPNLTFGDFRDPQSGVTEPTLWWIEYDRSNTKTDLQLDYWTQRYAIMQQRALNQRDPRLQALFEREESERISLFGRITVVVQTNYQVERYRRMFNREYADVIRRDRKTRRFCKPSDAARVPIKELIGKQVEILKYDELAARGLWRTAEEQRRRVLDSRYDPDESLTDA